jgi:hypothetical protein
MQSASALNVPDCFWHTHLNSFQKIIFVPQACKSASTRPADSFIFPQSRLQRAPLLSIH